MQGGRVRVELARDPRDRRGGGGGGGGGGGRFGGGGGGGGGGRFGGRDGGRPRGNPPGPRTNYRLVVENLSSRTSWQVMFYLYIFNWENCATFVKGIKMMITFWSVFLNLMKTNLVSTLIHPSLICQ